METELLPPIETLDGYARWSAAIDQVKADKDAFELALREGRAGVLSRERRQFTFSVAECTDATRKLGFFDD